VFLGRVANIANTRQGYIEMDLMKINTVKNPFYDAPVYFIESTISTMEDAKFLADNHSRPGTVIMTSYQEKGRGRFEQRKWLSKKGENLLFTIILSPEKNTSDFALLPLKIGLGLCEIIGEMIGLDAKVKWPNDVFVGTKKCAGILCEAYKENVLAGIGINCNQTDFSVEVAGKATSLALETGRVTDPSMLLSGVLLKLKRTIEDPLWLRRLNGRLALRGEKTEITIGHPYTENYRIIAGIVEKVDENGNLVLISDNGSERKTITSGEIIF
jgi:BirA family biotin operon repressor/biotin-[acetyl-CoA-carboxylase] ligase